MESEPKEYRPTRLRMILFLVLSVVFVAVGAMMARDPRSSAEDHAYGVLATALFGLGIPLWLYMLARPRSYLRVGPDRIVATSVTGKQILDFPLAELAAARVVRRGRQTFVALIPTNPEYGLENASTAARRVGAVTSALVGSRYAVTPSQYSVRPKALVAEIERARLAWIDRSGDYPRPAR